MTTTTTMTMTMTMTMTTINEPRLYRLGVLLLLFGLSACRNPDLPTGVIESKYFADGPWAVTLQQDVYCCDSRGNSFDVYYPTPLAGNGPLRPIITWGNGTGGVSSGARYFLKHLASWGFVVIATRDRFTGDGVTILDAAKKMATLATTSGNPFSGLVRPTQIGAIGHSQGAGGAIRAMIQSNGLITTVVPLELPGQQFCFCAPSSVLDTANITQGSVFFVDGTLDIPVSPPTQAQPANVVGEQSLAAFYAAVPGTVPKLTASLEGTTHNDISGQPGCDTATAQPCLVGVYGYLGYPTAWMADRLGLDPSAHAAFVSGTGEIFQQSHWKFVQSNIM